MENTRVFVNTPVMWHHKTGVLKNTRVFFVKYPGIFQYPGYMTLQRVLALFISIFLRNWSLSDARWFYGKKRKIGMENLY